MEKTMQRDKKREIRYKKVVTSILCMLYAHGMDTISCRNWPPVVQSVTSRSIYPCTT